MKRSESPSSAGIRRTGTEVIANATIAESLIGVFVALALLVTFRRKTSRAVELAVWIGLVWACVVAVTGARDPQTRELTNSAAWGISQVMGTIAGAFKVAALQWTYGARFLIADWAILLVGLDALALALVATNRQAGRRMPATRLREWWVLPGLPVPQPLRAATAVDEINQRFNTWVVPAGAAAAMWSILFLIWLRDVEIPIAARGLRDASMPAVDVLWRAAGRLRRPHGASSLARIAYSTSKAPGTRRARARATDATQLGPQVVQLDKLRADRLDARKATADTPTSNTAKHTAPAGTRKTNGSKKHRQSRLAS